MNSRERVQTALSFGQPDRCPLFATFVPETERSLRQSTACQELDLGVFLGNDMVKACVGLELSFYGEPYPEYTDAWGIGWRYARNGFCEFTEIVKHPLAGDMSQLESYTIPDPHEGSQYTPFETIKAQYGREKWLVGSVQISIFEAAWYLRGMEQLFLDMVQYPDYVAALMDKVMLFPLGVSQEYIKRGADMIWFGDDVSMQHGMMMSLDMWRQFLKPRYAQLFTEAKRTNPNIKIAYHSCGNCEAILDDMIEIGLDVLNPLQPKAIDPIAVKKRYGHRLALFGGLCIQELMPKGTPPQIKQEVTRLTHACGRGGGYILSPAHHIQADTSIDNIMAFYQAGLKPTTDRIQTISAPIDVRPTLFKGFKTRKDLRRASG